MSDLDDAVFYLHGQLRDRSELAFDSQSPGVVVSLADDTTVVNMTAVLDNGLEFVTSYDVGPAGELRIWQAKYDPTALGASQPTTLVLTYAPGWWRTVRGPLHAEASKTAAEPS